MEWLVMGEFRQIKAGFEIENIVRRSSLIIRRFHHIVVGFSSFYGQQRSGDTRDCRKTNRRFVNTIVFVQLGGTKEAVGVIRIRPAPNRWHWVDQFSVSITVAIHILIASGTTGIRSPVRFETRPSIIREALLSQLFHSGGDGVFLLLWLDVTRAKIAKTITVTFAPSPYVSQVADHQGQCDQIRPHFKRFKIG